MVTVSQQYSPTSPPSPLPSPLLLSVVTLYDPELLLATDSGDLSSSSRGPGSESGGEGTDGISSVMSLSAASENSNSCERLSAVFLVPFVISVSDFTKIKFKMQILLLKHFRVTSK